MRAVHAFALVLLLALWALITLLGNDGTVPLLVAGGYSICLVLREVVGARP